MHTLVIGKAPEGGYIVSDGFGDVGFRPPPFMFAATTIDETLKFVRSKFEPKVGK